MLAVMEIPLKLQRERERDTHTCRQTTFVVAGKQVGPKDATKQKAEKFLRS